MRLWRALRSPFALISGCAWRELSAPAGLAYAGPGARRFLRHAGPGPWPRGRYGYPGCIRWGAAGYTPQISQRRAHASVPGGWQTPGPGSGRRPGGGATVGKQVNAESWEGNPT